jgi:hypothetical protein
VVQNFDRLHGQTGHDRIGSPALQLLCYFEKHAMFPPLEGPAISAIARPEIPQWGC